MQERTIICCRARAWSQAVGWYQTILFGLTAVSAGILFGAMLSYRVEDVEIELIFGKSLTLRLNPGLPEEESKAGRKRGSAAFVGFIFAFSSIGFVISIVLLHGCSKKKPRWLQYWIWYGFVELAFPVIFMMAMLEEVMLFHKEMSYLKCCLTLCFITIQAFCIWVVGIYKEELEVDTESVFSVATSENPSQIFQRFF